MVDGWEEGIITKADFVKRTAALDQQARELRILLPVKAVAEFFAGFEDQPFDDQRHLLRTAFKEFVMDNSTITGLTLNVGALVGAKVPRDSTWRS